MAQLEIIDAHKHNLKNIHVSLPKGKIITITGVSGSGKSSLAYDTIFQEGQRRYLASLSVYARQFFKRVEKPEVKMIKGISPTVSIDQKHASYYYQSTVGTLSEISQYLRLIFTKLAQAHCPQCQQPIQQYSPQRILDLVSEKFPGKVVTIYAPVVINRKGSHHDLLNKYLRKGFLKVLIDETLYYIENLPSIDGNVKHNMAILIDSVPVSDDHQKQFQDSILMALLEGNGQIIIQVDNQNYFLSQRLFCPRCDYFIPEPQPATFSFNSPLGACITCHGSGSDENNHTCSTCQGSGLKIESLSFYLHGKNIFELGEMEITDLLGFFTAIRWNKDEQPVVHSVLWQIKQRLNCFIHLNLGYISLNRRIQTLSGGELQRTRLVSQIGFSLSGIVYILDEPSIGMHISEQMNLMKVLKELRNKGNTIIMVEHDETSITQSDYIIDLGPGSGSDGGSIVYAGPIENFSNASDSLTAAYVYHQRELKINQELSSKIASIKKTNDNNARFNQFIEIEGMSIHNLKNINLRIPLNAFTAITGVSGSGKSSLIMEGFFPIVSSHLLNKPILNRNLSYAKIKGIPSSSVRIKSIDQAVIGKSTRSCPATYLNIMPSVRFLFAQLPQTKICGYTSDRFSFNLAGGRCESCLGLGYKVLEMKILPQLQVECPVCQGKRFNYETLKIKYKGLSIADILQLTVHQAFEFFKPIPWIKKRLKILKDVGLGYIRLGQSSISLSGGEAQRLKIAKELVQTFSGETIYLFDEPTIGLHASDVQRLLNLFFSFINKGDTIVVIEHNLEMIQAADYDIDLGPGGGKNGGRIIYEGELPGLVECPDSLTGKYLSLRIKNAV